MSILTSFDSSGPGQGGMLATYEEVVHHLEFGFDLGPFTAAAKQHLHQLLPTVRLLAESDDDKARRMAYLTVILDKDEARLFDTLTCRTMWAVKLHQLVENLACVILQGDPQGLALVGSLRCDIAPMAHTIRCSVKQKWTFHGA